MGAILLLEDGRSFTGEAFGGRATVVGEMVFNTAMTGYQEVLTDPSYREQVVAMTVPHVGNYGVSTKDIESGKVQVSGFVARHFMLSGNVSFDAERTGPGHADRFRGIVLACQKESGPSLRGEAEIG